MEPSFAAAFEVLKGYGPIGLVLLFCFFDVRAMRHQSEEHRKDEQRSFDEYKTNMDRVLKQHFDFMTELRRMYESNVRLVEDYDKVSSDLKDVLILVMQGLQKLTDAIHTNQYCPHVRLIKQAEGRMG